MTRRSRLLLVLALLLAGLYTVHEHSVRRQVRAGLQTAIQASFDSIRAEGLPVSAHELAAWAAGPPLAENAADLFCLATNWFYRPAGVRRRWMEEVRIVALPIVDTGKLPVGAEVMDRAAHEAAAALLASNATALALLHQAARLGAGRFALDWTTPYAVRLPHLEPVRYGTRLLQLEALLHIEQ